MEDKKLPDMLQMAKNLATTAKDVVSDAIEGKDIAASQQQIKERISICNDCDWFFEKRCLKCGCFISVKSKLASAKCPLDKWDK
jgi:hypothetical protein